jgi:aspartyl/asparaginyl-tRNA synthetase
LIHDPATFPIVKADLSLEYLRSFPSIECFSVTKSAIYGIRSLIQQSFEKFFEQEDFTKTDMPLITFSECEGGCQPLQVTQHFASGDVKDIPLCEKSILIDFSKDFFGRKASLTVSSQLELETHLPLGKVWTMTRADYADDICAEHERYLTDVYFKHPVIVIEYPKHVKAFYMPVSGSFDTLDGRHIEYVDCFDILVPGVGELVGGSARIHQYDELEQRIK